LFLDEPTTGLDAALAYEVMSSIKTLAEQNRTIICTIHQPSPQTFELFNQLLLLSAGRVVYFGATKNVVDYFTASPLEFVYQRGQNPADYVVNIASMCSAHGKIVSSATSALPSVDANPVLDIEKGPKADPYIVVGPHDSRHRMDLAKHFLATAQYDAVEKSFESVVSSGTEFRNSNTHSDGSGLRNEIRGRIVLSHFTSVRNQVRVLCLRTFLLNQKNKKLLFMTFFRHVIVAVFYGTIYFHLATGTSQKAYTNRLCLFFFSSVFLLVGHQSTIPSLHQLRLVFYRERGSRAYGSFAYWLSNWIFEVPLIAINVTTFGVLLHILSGLRDTSQAWAIYLVVLFINSLIGLFVCHFVAAIASSTQAAVSIYPVFLFFSIAFAGFIIYLPDFPPWLGTWAPYLSFMRYSMQAMSLNEFRNNDEALPYSELYLDSLGYSSFTVSECVGYQSLFILVFGLLVLVAVEFVSFEVR
jgi:ABC-type multidrug transport system permease subunit